MRDYVILTDSSCDLPAEMAQELVLAEASVKSRIAKLCTKFEVDGRVRLLIRATELTYANGLYQVH